MAHAGEVEDESDGVVGEEEDVVDDLAVAGLDQVHCDFSDVDVRKLLAEEGLPFLAEEEHEGRVASGCVDWAKGHDVEGEEEAVGSSEAEFVPVAVSNGDLVKSRLSVNADPIQATCSGSKIVDCFVAAWDGKVVDEGDGVETAVGDAEAPNEVCDVVDVFLVGFGG